MNTIDCNHAKEQLVEELQEGITDDGFQLFLEKYPICRDELIDFYVTVNQLDELEKVEPTARMDEGFYAKLAREKPRVLKMNTSTNWIRTIAVAASIFISGALVGWYVFSDMGTEVRNFRASSEGSEEVTLVSNSSINRLEDIMEMGKAPKLNDKIIDALNKALVNDPNVNVRLSAIEAMLHYADNPKVRENLIKAIPYQDSPIVQMTLAEVMISLSESDSKEEWLKLFESDKVEEEVKMQLEETLEPVLKL